MPRHAGFTMVTVLTLLAGLATATAEANSSICSSDSAGPSCINAKEVQSKKATLTTQAQTNTSDPNQNESATGVAAKLDRVRTSSAHQVSAPHHGKVD